ncbi:ATP-binding protein [Salinicoccus roseus]
MELSGWGELFKSPETAAAILDRMVQYVKIFKIKGKSYRMKHT